MKTYTEITPNIIKSLIEEFGESFVFLHHTGNMYGMGCFADNTQALKRIKDLKKRNYSKGFVVLIPELLESAFIKSSINDNVGNPNVKLTAKQQLLMQQYWPGNLTFCVELGDSQPEFEDLAIDNRIAIRCPGDKLLRRFIKLAGHSVISTSVNESNDISLNNLDIIRSLDWFDFAVLSKTTDGINADEPRQSTIIGFDGDELKCYREGSISFREIEMSFKEPLILFICTGNICRSPMAEYYAGYIFKERGLPFRTASAGVFASGYPISTNSKMMLKNNNIDSEMHSSMQVNQQLIESSCLILTMENVHKNILYNMYPDSKHKVYTLAEYCGADNDISDPFSRDIGVYESTYELIKEYIVKLTDILEEKLN